MSTKEETENIRTEYRAITDYANNVVSHRLTILGFYLTAIALIVVQILRYPETRPLALFGLLVTIIIYIFDLRARITTHFLYKRAIEIEQSYWGYINKQTDIRDPFVSGINPTGLKELFSKSPKIKNYYGDPVKIFDTFEIRWSKITYSFALDIGYFASFFTLLSLLLLPQLQRIFSTMPLVIDKLTIDIISILVGGAGLLGALTKFRSGNIHKSYYNKNLYAQKASVIDQTTAWTFAVLSIFGLMIQAIARVYETRLEYRIYNENFYLATLIIGLIAVSLLSTILKLVSNKLAKAQWFPLLIQDLRDNFKLAEKESNKKDYERSIELISRIEDLLEIKPKDQSLDKRLSNLKSYFQ